MLKQLLILFCFYFVPINLLAQADTTLYVPEIAIDVPKVRNAEIGATIKKWDNISIQNNNYASVADFLQKEANVFVKSYGANSLATLSVRGASASQTLVLWNGLPVQSSMLGLLDMNLLPLNFSDNLSLQYGGNSSSWGSGAIGGVFSMNNEADFNNRFQINYHSSLGSFGALNQQLQVKLGNKKFQSVTKLLYQKAENDIVFRKDKSLPKERQENAAFDQKALLQSFYYKVNNKNLLEFHAWVQNSFKEIPATIVQTKSEAFQTDKFNRFFASWNHQNKKSNLNTKLAYFNQLENFQDPQNELISDNDFYSILADINYQYKINAFHQVNFANTHNFTEAKSEFYKNDNNQYRIAFLAAYQFEKNKWAMLVNLRQEIIDEKAIAPTPNLGAEYKILSNLIAKVKISRDFRSPTLNDLFWVPGGNPNLKAEQGWSEEIGLNYKIKVNKHQFNFAQNIYNRNIDDWILWSPAENSFFWQSRNIAKVWSWGTESEFKYKYVEKIIEFNYAFSASYTSSTYRVDIELPKVQIGDQLLYTPKVQINNSVRIRYKQWSIAYQHYFIGETLGANANLPAYNVGDLKLNYQYNNKKTSGNLFFALNNIYNKEYQVIERRPSPGINFQTGININFNQ